MLFNHNLYKNEPDLFSQIRWCSLAMVYGIWKTHDTNQTVGNYEMKEKRKTKPMFFLVANYPTQQLRGWGEGRWLLILTAACSACDCACASCACPACACAACACACACAVCAYVLLLVLLVAAAPDFNCCLLSKSLLNIRLLAALLRWEQSRKFGQNCWKIAKCWKVLQLYSLVVSKTQIWWLPAAHIRWGKTQLYFYREAEVY